MEEKTGTISLNDFKRLLPKTPQFERRAVAAPREPADSVEVEGGGKGRGGEGRGGEREGRGEGGEREGRGRGGEGRGRGGKGRGGEGRRREGEGRGRGGKHVQQMWYQ